MSHHFLTGFFFLFNQRSKQIDTSFDIFIGLSFQELLNSLKEFLAVESDSGQTAENISHISCKLAIGVFLKYLEKHLNEVRFQDSLHIFMIDQ